MTKSTPKPPLRCLEVGVSRTGKNIELDWRVRNEPDVGRYNYVISAKDVRNCSKQVRAALATLEASDWSEENTPEREPLLQAVAESGLALFEALMTGASDNAQAPNEAKAFRAWLEATVLADADAWRIQVVHQHYNFDVIPWGLVFSPLPGTARLMSLGSSYEDYADFWANRFKLAVRSATATQVERKKVQIRHDARINVTINAEHAMIERTTKEETKLGEYFAKDKLAGSIEKVDDLVNRYQQDHIFWYFFLEGDGDDFLLEGEAFSSADASELTRPKNEVRMLVLDGGCIFHNDTGAQWLQHILQSGRSGFIATETDIVNKQLVLCGWEFMRLIMESGDPLIDAMADARREFWPKSLFYGTYCDPIHASFEPPLLEEIEQANTFLTTIKALMLAEN